jgi:hydroxyethylthiazole kinase-like uncharacterized protein yjeF
VRYGYRVDAVRAAEAELMARLPEGTLMSRAAAGLARRAAALLPGVYGSRVVLLVGTGDNGGDALHAGALLAGRGARVHAVRVADRWHEAGAAALAAAGGRQHALPAADDLLSDADLVVDGILGIGGRGGLRPPADRLPAALAGLPVLAVDVPSGVDAGSGRVDGPAIRADVTVTFGAIKAGLLVNPGAGYAGQVELVDIGLSATLTGPPAVRVLDAEDVAALLPQPTAESDKYRRGVLGVAAGSDAYTGAPVLAVGGALAAGAGMVRYVGTAHPVELIRQHWPEAVCTLADHDAGRAAAVQAAGRVQAWTVGPGLGTDDSAAAVLRTVLDSDVPVLVDADGLTVLAGHRDWLPGRSAPTLLTPHAGEFGRLCEVDPSEVESDRLGWASRAAGELGATVLLKGTTTVVADPGGDLVVNRTATPWLATAGSGDVLSGACGALLAQGLSALDAGAVGAFLHGLAGRLASRPAGPDAGPAPIHAADIIAGWPRAVAMLDAEPG